MGAYLSAVILCAMSVVLGGALCCRRGAWSWTAPSVGLCAVVLIALGAVRLPGHGTTAAAALGLASLAALVDLGRRRIVGRSALVGLPTAAAVLAFCSLAFIANGRIGELGAGINDDLTVHMGQAEELRTLGTGADVIESGYPQGPHATVAALAEGLGEGVSAAFTGLLLATPVLTALTALAVLEGRRWYLRVLVATFTAIPYLATSYLAQGAFKEPLVSLILLGFILTLREARSSARGLSRRGAVALVLMAAAGVAVFGIVALAWPAAALLWLGALELAGGRRPDLSRWRARRGALGVRVAAVTGALALVIVVSQDFFGSGPGRFLAERDDLGGNFIGQLSPLEALGVWRHPDFRFEPTDWLHGPGLFLACAIVIYGLVWCWPSREWALLAGALGGLSVYAVARPSTPAYFSGKALAVVAPILTLIALTALATAISATRGGARRAVAAAALAGYVLLAGSSSALALRGAHVRPSERGPDLAAFRSIVRGEPTLYFGRDNYAPWELRTAQLAGYQSYSSGLGLQASEASAPPGGDADRPAVDVDSLDDGALDAFRYLVTPRTDYASVPPPNYKPITQSRWHVLWERRGPTKGRWNLDRGEGPGRVLDCRAGPGRLLARARGVAYVRPTPVVGLSRAWMTPTGQPGAGAARSGGSRSQTLRLGAGTWDISLRYLSDAPLLLRAGRLVRSLPAYVAERSTFFSAGRVVTAGGPLTVRVEVAERRRLGIERTAELGTLAATRVDERGRLVALARACGRYVDWFRPAPTPPE